MNKVTVTTKSEQSVTTPMCFLDKVCELWPCSFDLAANDENKRFLAYYKEEHNSLSKDWNSLTKYYDGFLWLNPPFKGVTKWMKKCALEGERGTKIVSLTLSSRGTKWYHEHVKPNALSLILLSRLTFENHKDPYPKELMINIFGTGITGEGYWNWNK